MREKKKNCHIFIHILVYIVYYIYYIYSMDIFMKLVFITNSCAKIDSDKSDFLYSLFYPFLSFILLLANKNV